MSHHPSRSLTLIIFLLTLLSIASTNVDAEQPLVDPIEWTEPPSRPEFRKLLTGKVYEERFQQALQQIGSISDLEASTTPSVGVKVTHVTPGAPGDELGITVGDSITHWNENVMWTSHPLSVDTDAEREIRIVTSSGNVRTVQLPTGAIGVLTQSFWHLELHYLRNGTRNPNWDREVVIGLWKATTDPELAETCWARAVAEGYPRDLHSAASGTVIAMDSHRAESAADFAYFCLEPDRDDGETVHPFLLFRVAMANFKLMHALEIAERSPSQLFGDHVPLLKKLISLHNNRSLEDRCVPTPSTLADQMYRDDIRSRAIPLNVNPSVARHVERLRTSPQGHLTAATAHFALAAFGPRLPAKNIDLQVRFRLEPADEETSAFRKFFECALEDMEHWDVPDRSRRGSEHLLYASLLENGRTRTAAGGLPVIQFSGLPGIEDSQRDQSFRLVRVNGQGEVFLNGTRVMYTPIDDDIDFVAIILKSVGMNVEILNLEAVELIERL